MEKISRKRLEFACEAFLTQMARAYAAAHPDAESPVKQLTDYPPDQRSLLMKAVGASIKSARAEADAAFTQWHERQKIDQ